LSFLNVIVVVGVIITKYVKSEFSLGQQPEVASHCGILAVNLAMKIIGNFYNTEYRHRL